MLKKLSISIGISILFAACGGESVSSSESITVPSNYSYKATNSIGKEIQGTVDGYSIQIYSDNKIIESAKELHKGLVVKVNGKKSDTMPIGIAYLHKNIVVALVDSSGKRVAVSDEIEVTDVPVIVVELSVE